MLHSATVLGIAKHRVLHLQLGRLTEHGNDLRLSPAKKKYDGAYSQYLRSPMSDMILKTAEKSVLCLLLCVASNTTSCCAPETE